MSPSPDGLHVRLKSDPHGQDEGYGVKSTYVERFSIDAVNGYSKTI